MPSLIIHGYYYRYREERKLIKDLVDSTNYSSAKTRLETAIAEHESKFPDSDTKLDFNYGEKIMMKHALLHLNAVIDKNDPEFVDNEGNIKHQSDIVKESLLQIPKIDYSD